MESFKFTCKAVSLRLQLANLAESENDVDLWPCASIGIYCQINNVSYVEESVGRKLAEGVSPA